MEGLVEAPEPVEEPLDKSGISSILIILAMGEVDSGDDASPESFTTSWMEDLDSAAVCAETPPTSSMVILLRGFWEMKKTLKG